MNPNITPIHVPIHANLGIGKDSLLFCLFVLLYKIAVDIGYVWLSPRYAYYGLTLAVNYWKLVSTYFWLIIFLAVIPKRLDKFSSFANLLIFLFTLIPMWSRYAMNDEPQIYMFVTSIALLLQTLIIRFAKNFLIPSIERSNPIIAAGAFLIGAYVFGMLMALNGLPSLTAMNYFDVYEVRRAAVSFPLSGYAISALCGAILPFCVALFFHRKQYYKFTACVLMQLLAYLYTGHKYYIFIVPLIVIVSLGVRTRKLPQLLSGLLAAAIPLALLIGKAFGMDYDIFVVPITIIYRVLFLPAQIKFQYYHFMDGKEFLHFSEGQIGRLLGIPYPYEKPLVNLIGEAYYHSDTVAANSGYLADGYVQAGFAGIILMALLFALIVKLIDSVSAELPVALVCACLAGGFYSLTDISLLTALLTGGLFCSILLLYGLNAKCAADRLNGGLRIVQIKRRSERHLFHE